MNRSLLMLLGTLAFSANAIAGNGRALVPHWAAHTTGDGSTTSFNLSISNVTDHNLQVSVKFYAQNGALVSQNLNYTNWQNSNTVVGAHQTAGIQVTYLDKGYAVIEWSNQGTDDDAVGVIAHANRYASTSHWSYAVPINGGLPF